MGRRTSRYIFFTLAILVGIAAGIIFGWQISPVQYRNTGPHTLRIDYKTDYVLMVATLYEGENDSAMAVARLSFLGSTSPVEMVQTAIAYAEENQYTPGDLQQMLDLVTAIKRLPLDLD